MRPYTMTLGIDADVFDSIAIKLAELFKLDTRLQCIDSVHIKFNMRGWAEPVPLSGPSIVL